MKRIQFFMQYTTPWGEMLCIDYYSEGQLKSLVLQTENGSDWTGEVELPADAEDLCYSYRIVNRQLETLSMDGNTERRVHIGFKTSLLIYDKWEPEANYSVYLRTAFTRCIFRQPEEEDAGRNLLSYPYLLLVHVLPAPEGWRWGILGNTPSLGQWKTAQVRYLQHLKEYEWGVPLTADDFEKGTEYKYVLVNETDAQQIIWETGENRSISPVKIPKGCAILQSDNLPRIQLRPWRGAGVVIPVSSLRSKGSFGVGDFGDLHKFIGWAADAGMSAVQLLPINDTTASKTWRDSYPYNGISVFALHPIYLDIREWKTESFFERYRLIGEKLNEAPQLDYEAVLRNKMLFLKDLYANTGKNILKSKGYKDFVRQNRHWLADYVLFAALRDANGTSDFRIWKVSNDHTLGEVEAATTFYAFVQYLLFRQMTRAHEYAREKKVILKGDIPIGISRDSVSAWTQPQLFHFDGQAGAPPDAFATKGQNWGFPTYNWERMSHDGYAWWSSRLQQMSHFFDAYRIDHVLGFFRIWEIPSTQIYGTLGYFRPALPLSEKELKAAGFHESPKKWTSPYLSPLFLQKHSYLQKETDIRRFMEERAEGVWTLKKDFDTQRKIMELVPEGKVRDGLLDAVSEVLFIEDKECPGHYHPRISAQQTTAFQSLPAAEQSAFNRLYDDFFYVRHNEFWAREAMKKIPAVTSYDRDSKGMLPCAEDLGMVPASVKDVLEQLRILSLEIQDMPKTFGVHFGHPERYPYLSVATIATHDMPPFRLWWQTHRKRAQLFWTEVMHRTGEAPREAGTEICEQVIREHLDSPSMLCLLALQDWLGMDEQLRSAHSEREQINVPADAHHNWNYRIHLNVEDLIQASHFNEKVRNLIKRSGRWGCCSGLLVE